MSLRLVRQFGVVTRQGAPSFGLRKFGVPVGGAFDQESLLLANTLVGGGAADAAWELGLAQARFATEVSGTVAVVGALASILHRGDRSSSNCAFAVDAGDEFTVEAPSEAARVYVSVGSVIRQLSWRTRLNDAPSSVLNRNTLRVTLGPQAELFDPSFLKQPFTVSRTGNRVGVRLQESIGAHKIELPSEPSCVGAIQVSNDGTLILLGPDGPTIGGYPKIAVVSSCDLARFGQLAPGEPVRFEVVTLAEARSLAAEAAADLNRRVRMLRLAVGLA